jgi:putative DNA primase/helicase
MNAPSPLRVELERAALARQGRREGREIRFLCPAHEDRHPSARLSSEKGAWFCDACKAGGGWRDLAERFGLVDGGHRAAGGEVVSVYRYDDASGRLLYEVLRKVPKGFACRRPDGAGGWVWNLAGVERVLYRLPEVMAAIAAQQLVFVVEGEKDCDALAELGLVGTTNPGGAGKWRAAYAETLRGARAVVIPDQDEAGRAHAAAVLRSLAGTATEVRLLELGELPPKGDLSDWIAAQLAAGRRRGDLGQELLRLAAEAAPWRGPARAGPGAVRSRRMADVTVETVAFLWPPYLPLRKLTLLEGDPGQGKSWLTAAIAASGSRGDGLPGMGAFAPFGSLFFTVEDGLGDTLRPRLEALGADLALIFGHEEAVQLDTPEGLAEIEREIEARRPGLVVVDPVMAFVGAGTDIYRANEVRSVLRPLAKMAQAHGCSILAVRHVNKLKGGRAIYAGQGSIDFTAAARSVLLAGSAAGDDAEHAVLHIKANLAAKGPALGYRIEGGRFCWTGESGLTAGDLLAAEPTSEELSAEEEARSFLREMLAAGPAAAREVTAAAKGSGIAERTLRRAKKREGVVVRRVEAQGRAEWHWNLPADGVRRPRRP